MHSTFWTYTIWYIFLGITTVVEIILFLTKSKDPKQALALFFTVSGMTFTFELTVFCFLKGYNYFPMITPEAQFDDGLIGNLFSQFSVTSTALLIAVLNLKHYWFYICAGIYGVIEELFIYIGIFKHFWYRTWMTVAGLILLFWMSKRMYNNLKIAGRVMRYIYILFGLYTLHMPVVIFTFKRLGIQTFNENILRDNISSYSLLAALNLFFLANVMMIIYFLRLTLRWKTVVILCLYVLYYITYKFNLLVIKDGWFLIFTTVNIFSMYLGVYILDKLYEPVY